MNGILLVDKPAGITSHTVVAKLRRKLQTKKIGHAGTLDPTATGLLVLCIGYATKISGYVMDLDKAYQTKFKLGETTTTFDIEGEIASTKDATHITEKNILDVLPKFTGAILQKPPIYSAIKIKGKKLYQYARSNTEVEIPTRNVNIHLLKLVSFDSPFGVLDMECSKGTYVRSLVHDLGQELGVGAHVQTIHRTKSAPFSIKNAISLSVLLEMELEDIQKHMISVNDALSSEFHRVEVMPEEEIRIRQGVEYSKANLLDQKFTSESMFLFISKAGHEVAIAQWGTKDRIEFLRIL